MLPPKNPLRILFPAILWLFAAVHSSLAAPWTPADLGDRLWLDWWAEDLADGSVATWTSRNGPVNATQGTAANRPTKQNGEVFFATNQRLTFPPQDRAHIAHRAIMVLFRIDLTGSGSGRIFAVNGVGGGYERQPAINYNRTTNLIGVTWSTPSGANSLAFTVAENASQWHCLVSRRVGVVHYASLDGKQIDGITPGESQVAMADWALPRINTPVTGYIGDNGTAGPAMAIDSVLIMQDEMGLEEAQKVMGWAMWRRGAQAQLPASHPYRNAAPVSTPPDYVFTESTPAEYSALEAFWYDDAQAEQNKGAPLNLSGWNLVFEDQFDQHTVTGEVRGKGNWFAPTHGATTGTATAIVPPLNATDPALGTEGTPSTYIQANGAMTIRMQNSNGWKSGAFCSVNLNGYGRAWMYPYAECRMKTGPSSTGSVHGSYPSFWIKSQNFFYNLSESYLEYDVYEGYISDNDGFHNSYHNHPGLRPYPGRLADDRYLSHYLGLKTPGWYQNVNLFDNQYHTYGVMVTPTWTITYFDQREVSRFPTPVEMQQPLWLLTALAMNPKDMVDSDGNSTVGGIYELTVDYIRVYQNPAYDLPPPIAEYKFDETGTTAASSGSDSTSVTIYNASGVATDLHTVDGGGVSGQSGDRALNFTAATGMGSGTGPYARHLADDDNIDALKSFTVTGWFKTAGTTPLGGNYPQLVRTETAANGAGYNIAGNSTNGTMVCNVDNTGAPASAASYGATQQWVFFAVSYEGTSTANNVKYYAGSSSAAASLVSTVTLNKGAVDENTVPLIIGNRLNGTSPDRPFDGYLDNIRIYGSKADASGVLTLSQLETVRQADKGNTLP